MKIVILTINQQAHLNSEGAIDAFGNCFISARLLRANCLVRFPFFRLLPESAIKSSNYSALRRK
jgi:hypothetical protein